MRKILYALAAAGLVMSAPTLAAPCKDAKGKFTKCPPRQKAASRSRRSARTPRASSPSAARRAQSRSKTHRHLHQDNRRPLRRAA